MLVLAKGSPMSTGIGSDIFSSPLRNAAPVADPARDARARWLGEGIIKDFMGDG